MASGVPGLVAGPSSAFQTLNYRVRLFSSLGLMVAPPACEPGADTLETFAPRLHHLAPGRPLLLAVRSPGATGLASYLSGCLSSLFSGARFDIADFRKVSQSCLDRAPFPVRTLYCSAFRPAFLGTPLGTPKSSARADTQ